MVKPNIDKQSNQNSFLDYIIERFEKQESYKLNDVGKSVVRKILKHYKFDPDAICSKHEFYNNGCIKKEYTDVLKAVETNLNNALFLYGEFTTTIDHTPVHFPTIDEIE